MREIISPESLEELGMLLGEGGTVWLDYLGALRNIYSILVQPNLDVTRYKEGTVLIYQVYYFQAYDWLVDTFLTLNLLIMKYQLTTLVSC